MKTFSERNGLDAIEPEITVRNDAPEELRQAIILISYKAGLKPSTIRDLICETLLKAPDRSNWSEYPNIDGEVNGLILDCEWFEAYDVIESIGSHITKYGLRCSDGSPAIHVFENDLNRYFRKNGIGWQLVCGRVEVRGHEIFETVVRQARDELSSKGKQTASKELHEALQDLSRRPAPEITGAIQHAMAALECVAREKCATKDTLGDIIRRNPGLFPKPVDVIADKAWGWTSNNGRHLLEGGQPSFEEAELMVGISGVLCTYLSRRL